MFKDLNDIYDSEAIMEKDNIIGIKSSSFNITIEPGGQLEISTEPYNNIHQLYEIYNHFYKNLSLILEKKNLFAVSMGYHPIQANELISLVPKKRYHIMEEYLKDKGILAPHMMKSTASTQVTLDYEDDSDFSKKYQLCNRLAVISEIIFDNAPFYNRAMNGNNFTRIQCWMNCDDERCGMIEKAFSRNYSFNAYLDYILNVPMILTKSENEIIGMGHLDYRSYLKNNPFDLTILIIEVKKTYKQGVMSSYAR